MTPLGAVSYRLWYAYADKLLADPDDRDGLMAIGAFYETLRLCAERLGLQTQFEPAVAHHDAGIDLGIVTFAHVNGVRDPLSENIGQRQCNRHPYAREPLPAPLAVELEALGNTLLSPFELSGLVGRASAMSWQDRRFLADLRTWTRFDDRASDGMTLDCLRVRGSGVLALRLALALPRLPGAMAWLYSRRDVWLAQATGAMAVLTVTERTPIALFESGRRLLRSWALINARGYAWHPMSVVIDQPTVAELRRLIGGRDPVAIYRVGRTSGKAGWSLRRPLEAILVRDGYAAQPRTM